MKISTMPCSTLTRTIRLLVVAVALTGVSPAVLAANEIVLEKTTVRFGDLNLEMEVGAQALVTRLHRAATRICCDNRPTPLELKAGVQSRFLACRDKAMHDAVVTLNRQRNGDIQGSCGLPFLKTVNVPVSCQSHDVSIHRIS